MSGLSFARMLTVVANVERPSASTTGTGTNTVVLAGIKITPFDPFTPDPAMAQALATPYEIVQTFSEVDGIRNGDYIVPMTGANTGRRYRVLSVGEWEGFGGVFKHVKCEDRKT